MRNQGVFVTHAPRGYGPGTSLTVSPRTSFRASARLPTNILTLAHAARHALERTDAMTERTKLVVEWERALERVSGRACRYGGLGAHVRRQPTDGARLDSPIPRGGPRRFRAWRSSAVSRACHVARSVRHPIAAGRAVSLPPAAQGSEAGTSASGDRSSHWLNSAQGETALPRAVAQAPAFPRRPLMADERATKPPPRERPRPAAIAQNVARRTGAK